MCKGYGSVGSGMPGVFCLVASDLPVVVCSGEEVADSPTADLVVRT